MTPTFEVFQIELTSNERDIHDLYKNDRKRENQQFALYEGLEWKN